MARWLVWACASAPLGVALSAPPEGGSSDGGWGRAGGPDLAVVARVVRVVDGVVPSYVKAPTVVANKQYQRCTQD